MWPWKSSWPKAGRIRLAAMLAVVSSRKKAADEAEDEEEPGEEFEGEKAAADEDDGEKLFLATWRAIAASILAPGLVESLIY